MATPAHLFIADDYSLLETGTLHWPRILGHRQMTNAYLLGLAVRHHCRFVSFDARISWNLVPAAEAGHLCVLSL